MSNKIEAALELRKALQFFLETLDPETQLDKVLEIPSVYPSYAVGKAYAAKEIFSYGVNSVGDPQLYQVLQAHISAAEWTPDTTPGLYKVVGVTESGYPKWVQPLGAADAYNEGDIVSFSGELFRSVIDGNVWSPDTYPAGWEVYAE